MAVTQNTYTGNGSSTNYSFTFPYLETTDIKVSLDGSVTTAYTLANATTIQFNTAPANGVAIRIYRQTDDADLAAQFYPGSAIRSQDLNDNFTQNLYVTQESNREAEIANTTANSATATSNTALSTSQSALTTAQTAETNSNTAISTANTASSNASAAVSTANTASSNATTAVNTANAATATANSAASDAATAISTANGAVTTANSAAADAATAISTANTASSNASAAVSTANTASTNASTAVSTANSAVTTANNAVTTANSAVTTANAADSKADQAISAVANALLFTIVADVAAIPGSPSDGDAVEVTDSTGIESFTPLTGVPSGFVGDSGLGVRLVYNGTGSTWTWLQYFPQDPETRYGDAITTLQGDVSGLDTNKLAIAGGTMTGALGVTAGSAASPSVFISGDPNTGIYSPGADQVAISTGGTGRLFVDASGNVGVGGSPSTNFHVQTAAGTASQLRVTTGSNASSATLRLGQVGAVFWDQQVTTTDGHFLLKVDGGNDAYKIERASLNANTHIFTTGASERLRITSDGKLGLGTSSPDDYLTVSSSDTSNSLSDSNAAITLVNADSGAFGRTSNLNFNQGNSATAQRLASISSVYTNYTTSVGGALAFSTNDGNGTVGERLRITSDGKVGIGTTAPAVKLQVSASSTGEVELARFRIEGQTNNPMLRVVSDEANKILTLNTSGSASGTQLAFKVTNTEAVRIDSSGNVGIGTSAPNDILHVVESSASAATPATASVANFERNGSAGITISSTATATGSVFFADSGSSAVGRLQYNHNDNSLGFWANSLERARIDLAGRLGIGTTAPANQLHLQTSTGGCAVRVQSGSTYSGTVFSQNAADAYISNESGATGTIQFWQNGSEKARIDSSGRLLVGTSSARANFFNGGLDTRFQLEGNGTASWASFIADDASTSGPIVVLGKQRSGTVGGNTIVQDGDNVGQISFQGSDGTEFVETANIRSEVDGTPGANDMPGRLVFSTTPDGSASPVERMRITNTGRLYVNTTDTSTQNALLNLQNSVDGDWLISCSKTNKGNVIQFFAATPSVQVGKITVSTTNTSYSTSSDYRLKENVVPLTGAIDRVNQLQVHRFNFIADPDTTVDGFIAHEAQSVVPECVTGTKDEVDEDGNPVYQGIDQSKLVPLLTAALQEAMERIEVLEAKVNALVGS
ncbi:tail fiber protein [Synechococcus phage S-CBP1]|uniref:Tail fiber n=1 Tax=Synechococcus phage S-CBP1 TaxID=1273711 RepID=A0A096VKG4_9CAUD|nr:tail fiber protein [Synechococcus phage S-CBP1]AGK86542.1 tail fiber [Synechococcus phage S-CBP1]